MGSFEFDKIKNYVISDLECRLFEYKGKYCYNTDFIFTDIDVLIEDDVVLVKNKSFDNIQFDGVDFKKYEFVGCSFKNSIFKNCYFDVSMFDKCDMEYGVFKDCSFENLILSACGLRGFVFVGCKLSYFCVRDCDCRSFKFVGCDVCDFEFNDSLITKFDEDTFIDKIVSFKKLDKYSKFSFYENSYKFYKNIAYKFQQNNLLSFYGEYYYISKIMERKNLKGISKLKSTALWLICGYGERPTYALVTSIEIIFIFTILYMLFGINCGSEIISYKEIFLEGKPFNFIASDFITAVHFSIVTFTTVGYGDVTPIGYSIFISGIEMFLGVTMVGLWTATLARKISR